MLEVRYNTDTKKLTAWCGDEKQFGNLKREGHTVVILDIPIPEKTCLAYLFDEATQTLIDNPDYVEPKPPRDPLAEIDELRQDNIAIKAGIEKLKEVTYGT